MTRRLSISSSSNDRLKTVRRLRRRRDESVFLVEGHRQLRHALEAGVVVAELYAAPDLFLGEADWGLVDLAEQRGARVLEVTAEAFASISGQVRPDGLAAVVARWPTDLGRLRLAARPLLMVTEGIERPGNLGTTVRTACAAGADALVVCDGRTDLFHLETVRGSVGTIFRLPVARTRVEPLLAWLVERGIRVVVATPDGERPYWECDYGGATAVVVGSERHGVTARWLGAADATVRIPMAAAADSLNVAVAAGVVLLEAARQRRGGPADVAAGRSQGATSAVDSTAPVESTTPSSQRASTSPPLNCWR